MFIKKILLSFLYIFLFFHFQTLYSQKTFEEIRNLYDKKSENDITALKYIERYIKKAKDEKNFAEQVQGYRDATFYIPDDRKKIIFVDSAIATAHKAADIELISTVYLLKGSLYYYYKKDYQTALAEYLKAYHYSKDVRNEYLRYKIIYQMGLVKSYLGYYNEAIEHFEECIRYFESKTSEKLHPNASYNFKKGYLNSLHQIAVCYRNIKNYKKADSIINIGLKASNQATEFSTENAYFLKCKGISEFYNKNYNFSRSILLQALPVLNKHEDFYWISVAEFYLGKNYLGLKQDNLAIQQFEKVDSIFQKRKFIVPELLDNYNLLIKYYQQNKDYKKELEYSKKLLLADSIINKDFKYLSAKIHKEYDRRILEESGEKLKKYNFWSMGAIILLVFLLFLLAVITWKYYKNNQLIKNKYDELEQRIHLKTKSPAFSYESISNYGKSVLNKEIFTDLQSKLNDFESIGGFKENGLTIDQLANSFNSNKTYLSQYINDVKGTNFSKYLSTLRINYITKLMYNDPRYLRLKIQGLADECGISSRQNFSDLFQEVNGIRPADFIKQRKKEMDEHKKISEIISES